MEKNTGSLGVAEILSLEAWRNQGTRNILRQVMDSFSVGFGRKDHSDVEERIYDEIRLGHKYLLAVSNGTIVGGVSGYRYWEDRHRLWELNHIWVVPCDVPGLGDRLVESMFELAHAHFRCCGFKGARWVFLHTHDVPRPERATVDWLKYVQNRAAHALYTRSGFTRYPFLPNFCRPGVPELTYARYFPEHES